jgi:hypothetical protein
MIFANGGTLHPCCASPARRMIKIAADAVGGNPGGIGNGFRIWAFRGRGLSVLIKMTCRRSTLCWRRQERHAVLAGYFE